MTYDAEGDSHRLAASLQQWSRLGFLRGFVGMRSDLGPKGRLVLPSAAFHEAAMRAIGTPGSVPDEELDARRAYVDEVEERLQDAQSEAIAEHYRKAFWGWAVDLAVGWLTVLVAAVAWYFLGWEHPATIAILILFSIKSVVVHIHVRRVIARSMNAFQVASADIRMPWQA